MPVDTMVSAISRTVLSSTFSANLFQLFHPMGGVGARSAAKQIGARESTATMIRCIVIECIASAMGGALRRNRLLTDPHACGLEARRIAITCFLICSAEPRGLCGDPRIF